MPESPEIVAGLNIPENMLPRIEKLKEKKIVGMRMTMTYSKNKTFELWKGFMPRRKEIRNLKSADLYSIQVYSENFNFRDFDFNAEFEKWAGAEVSDISQVPDGMESLILKDGLYAVFIHKGPASKGEKTFRYIFEKWLPGSGYMIDYRPHFEILGEKYKNEDPDSEEEVWIPVKPTFLKEM